MEKKCLLQQDECAPDSLEHFDKRLLEITGFLRKTFLVLGKKTESDDGLHTEYRLDNFILSFDGDDPYYKLERRKNG